MRKFKNKLSLEKFYWSDYEIDDKILLHNILYHLERTLTRTVLSQGVFSQQGGIYLSSKRGRRQVYCSVPEAHLKGNTDGTWSIFVTGFREACCVTGHLTLISPCVTFQHREKEDGLEYLNLNRLLRKSRYLNTTITNDKNFRKYCESL